MPELIKPVTPIKGRTQQFFNSIGDKRKKTQPDSPSRSSAEDFQKSVSVRGKELVTERLKERYQTFQRTSYQSLNTEDRHCSKNHRCHLGDSQCHSQSPRRHIQVEDMHERLEKAYERIRISQEKPKKKKKEQRLTFDEELQRAIRIYSKIQAISYLSRKGKRCRSPSNGAQSRLKEMPDIADVSDY